MKAFYFFRCTRCQIVGFILRSEMRRVRVRMELNFGAQSMVYYVAEVWCSYCASRMLPEQDDRRHKHTLGLGG